MKVSFVSSHAINQAMRYQVLRTQADMVKANTELVTGRFADVGLALGARTGISVSLHREVDRLNGLIDSNNLASTRLEATQLGLQQLTDAAGDLLQDYMTALDGATDPTLVKQQSDMLLSLLTSVLNGNLAGEHLYAGINTDVRPLSDFFDPAAANRVAFDDAFVTFFGFPPDDPDAADITAPEMADFLATEIEPQFLGAGWNTLWSTATDQQITSRITLTETAQTSVSANIPAFRKLAMAAATVSATFDGSLSQAARDTILERGLELLGEVIVDLANQQGATGITEQRIDRANERMSMQIDLFKLSLFDLEGVDEFEALTRVKGLEAQLELSQALTVRMQQFSLLRFL